MSCDGLFVLRQAGRDTYYYDRWAAQRIDRLLLGGPEATVAFIAGLERTEEPVLVNFLCGAVFVDLDRRELLYWAEQCFGGGSLQRYYWALLGPRWHGWTTRWAMRPLLEFTGLLGREPRALAVARERAALCEVPGLFIRPWQEMLASFAERPDDLSEWIAASGEAGVRDAAELSCDAWVTVRGEDGTLYDQCDECWAIDSLLRVGPGLVALAQVGGPRPEMLWPGIEGRFTETLFVDVVARTVHWWCGAPGWLHPAGFCDALWPGWTLIPELAGTRGHMQRSGRPFAAICRPRAEAVEALRETLARVLGPSVAPLEVLAREARRVAAEQPGVTVTITTAATSAAQVEPEEVVGLDALVAAVDGLDGRLA